jgi:hypothetical protein
MCEPGCVCVCVCVCACVCVCVRVCVSTKQRSAVDASRNNNHQSSRLRRRGLSPAIGLTQQGKVWAASKRTAARCARVGRPR